MNLQEAHNQRLLHRMQQAGYENGMALAAAMNVFPPEVYEVLNLKVSPYTIGNKWRAIIVKIATFLRCLPEDIIPRALQHEHIASLAVNAALGDPEVQAMLAPEAELPDAPLEHEQALKSISQALLTLSPKEERILRLRFGISCQEMTLKEVGVIFGVQQERIRQIEAKALRKLKHPSREKLIPNETFGIVRRSFGEQMRRDAQRLRREAEKRQAVAKDIVAEEKVAKGIERHPAERFSVGDRVRINRKYWEEGRALSSDSHSWYDQFDLDRVVTVTKAIIAPCRPGNDRVVQQLTLDGFVHAYPHGNSLEDVVYNDCWFEAALEPEVNRDETNIKETSNGTLSL